MVCELQVLHLHLHPVLPLILLPLLPLVLACRALRGPDVVLLTVDTLRVDHVGAFAPESPARTPAIDALAADGVRYPLAFSPISVTGPAFVSLFTGQEPGTHGVVLNVFRGGPTLGPDRPTLATALGAHRFRTAAFLSGFTLRQSLGLARGFERYDAPPAGEKRRPGERTTRRALTWLEEQPAWARLFLWWHSYDPHGPFDRAPEVAPLEVGWARDPAALARIPAYQRIDGISDPHFYERRYAGAVERADQDVGRLLAALKAAGRYDDALIVLTADHGESFTERELWFDHGTHASVEQLRVPLIIKYPGGAGAGTTDERLVSLVDLAPTILDQLGLPALPGADGQPIPRSTRTEVMGESSHCKREAALTCWPRGPGGKELALRDAERSLLRRPVEGGVGWERYDRRADPRELRTLPPGQDDAWAVRLDAAFADRGARGLRLPGGEDEGEAESSEEVEALRALGYVE